MSKHLEAINAAELFLFNYQGNDQETLPWKLLLALVQLSKPMAEQEVPPEKVRYTAKDICEEMLNIEGVKPTKDPGSYIRNHFKNLKNKKLPETEEQLNSLLTKHNFDVSFLVRNQTSSGGATNEATYWIEAKELDKEFIANEKEVLEHDIPEGGLRYSPEQSKLPFYSKWLRRFDLLGWKRTLWITLICLPLIPWIAIFIMSFLFASVPEWKEFIGESLILSVMLFMISAFVLNPIHRVINQRVIRAPEILAITSFDNVLLELRTIRDQNEKPKHKQLRLITYTATCPICKGKVEIESGGLSYWGRLIGRCSDSPREHIFSFDHITRTGSPLRHTG